jgi:hypothetical protein
MQIFTSHSGKPIFFSFFCLGFRPKVHIAPHLYASISGYKCSHSPIYMYAYQVTNASLGWPRVGPTVNNPLEITLLQPHLSASD